MKPIIAIGDIHGLNYWGKIIEAHPGCRVVFLGDYLDPQIYIPREELLQNLENIILFKRESPEDVILLLGNHDIHYFNEEAIEASRFDSYIAKRAKCLFLENQDCFQYAWQEGKKLFTHAGIAHEWFTQEFHGDINAPVAIQLNHPSREQIPALFQAGRARGGSAAWGGIFWADRSELNDPLHGFVQIVGHNRVRDITIHEGSHNNKIIFCDCLRAGNYLYLE